MALELWIDRAGPLLRAAMVRDGALFDLFVDSQHCPSQVGSVHVGRVARRMPGSGGVFVDIGGNSEVWCETAPDGEPAFLVQITRDADGAKQAKASAEVALAGRYVVALSRGGKVRVPYELDWAKAAAKAVLNGLGCGFILRTHGARQLAQADLAPLRAEAEMLAAQMLVFKQALAIRTPRRLAQPPNAIDRAMLLYGQQIAAIRADESAAALVRGRDGVQLHRGTPGLFELTDLEGAFSALASPTVPLPGGASLVIEPTAALVAVDVNAGAVPPETINFAMLGPLAQQLRLRNLAGTIVVDLVGVPETLKEQRKLLAALEDVFADDPCGAVVHGITRLGLVEITRTRRGLPLHRLLLQDDPSRIASND